MVLYLDRMCQCGLHAVDLPNPDLANPVLDGANDLANPVLDGVGLAGFKSTANDFLLA